MYTIKDFELAAEALSMGLFDTSSMISKIMPVEEVEEAMNIVVNKTENIIKLLLKF